jgi:hypothetical protein
VHTAFRIYVGTAFPVRLNIDYKLVDGSLEGHYECHHPEQITDRFHATLESRYRVLIERTFTFGECEQLDLEFTNFGVMRNIKQGLPGELVDRLSHGAL